MPIYPESVVGAPWWTSREELERMFGRTNITRWADIENENVAEDITAQIQWSVVAGHEDAVMRLEGTSCGIIYTAPSPLRIATTRLAAFLLYSARGIKDAPEDQEGRSRLSTAKKLADEFFKMVRAGQYSIGSGLAGDGLPITSYPEALRPFDPTGQDRNQDQIMEDNIADEHSGIQGVPTQRDNIEWAE
jgi:hypothetical protein